MLKARITRKGRQLIVFGLSHENLDRLRNGQPIAFDLGMLGLQGEVLIMAGESEKTIADELGIEIPNKH